MSRIFHRICAAVLFAAALLAQEPGAPTFDSSTKLLLLPFHVERGKYFAADLQASDFILREDGHPRPFTVFEGPNTPHPLPLELILLFDTTPKDPEKDKRIMPNWDLDPKADYEFLGNWDESITREVLEKNGMDVRIAVYHYNLNQMERLCAASSDPREIVRAFHALLDPIPQGKGELTLLPGDSVTRTMFGDPVKMAWLNESVVTTLKDAAASPVPARRLLILFTQGGSGTGSKSPGFSNIVDPALAMNIPIDSVIMVMDKQEQHLSGSGPGMIGALATTDAPKSHGYKGFLPGITKAGEMTGGESFVPHRLDRGAMAGILGQARDTALSQYVVGFSPDGAAQPKKHSLAVALSAKSKGKVTGGERDGVVY